MKTPAMRKLRKMAHDQTVEYLTAAKYVTVGHVEQVEGNSFVRHYVAKIRGVIVGNAGEWYYDTPEQALAYGRYVLARWKEEARQKAEPQP